ncbi:MAG TPA: hypothetical protein VFJ91_03710 [Gaiellaceae bacterium]|nr:hypothetical protein [Gaiellaceae bacterium]
MTEPKPERLEAPSAESTTPGRKTGGPRPPGEILQGRDETTPLRAWSRVWLVVATVAVIVAAIAYGLWSALN